MPETAFLVLLVGRENVVDTGLEAVGPIGNLNAEGFLDFGLVQYGVCRTGDW